MQMSSLANSLHVYVEVHAYLDSPRHHQLHEVTLQTD